VGHLEDKERQLLDFWFGAPTADGGYEHKLRWFRADPAFDAECTAQYAELCARAA
jgi:uncharacterized protein (DUF924 family)